MYFLPRSRCISGMWKIDRIPQGRNLVSCSVWLEWCRCSKENKWSGLKQASVPRNTSAAYWSRPRQKMWQPKIRKKGTNIQIFDSMSLGFNYSKQTWANKNVGMAIHVQISEWCVNIPICFLCSNKEVLFLLPIKIYNMYFDQTSVIHITNTTLLHMS